MQLSPCFVFHKLFAAWVKLWIACIYLFLSHSPVKKPLDPTESGIASEFFLVNVIIWSDVLSKEVGFGWIVLRYSKQGYFYKFSQYLLSLLFWSL